RDTKTTHPTFPCATDWCTAFARWEWQRSTARGCSRAAQSSSGRDVPRAALHRRNQAERDGADTPNESEHRRGAISVEIKIGDEQQPEQQHREDRQWSTASEQLPRECSHDEAARVVLEHRRVEKDAERDATH